MHLILIGGSRMAWRLFNHHLTGRRFNGSRRVPTLIVGAGKGGDYAD